MQYDRASLVASPILRPPYQPQDKSAGIPGIREPGFYAIQGFHEIPEAALTEITSFFVSPATSQTKLLLHQKPRTITPHPAVSKRRMLTPTRAWRRTRPWWASAKRARRDRPRREQPQVQRQQEWHHPKVRLGHDHLEDQNAKEPSPRDASS